MYGKDYDYAQSRLVDSIVRINKSGEPVIIESVNMNSGITTVYVLSSGERANVALDNLNLKPVPLGWCNQARGATYLARIPKRRDWRQGIRAETCFSSAVRFGQIAHIDLARCIKGEYPKLSQLLKKPHKAITVAWSRKWASDGKQLFFGHLGVVGEMKDDSPVLADEFSFLKESLEKSLS